MKDTKTGTTGKPWWKEPWPWLLMSGPAVVVVAGVITMNLAYRYADDVIRTGYVKEGMVITKADSDAHGQHPAGKDGGAARP